MCISCEKNEIKRKYRIKGNYKIGNKDVLYHIIELPFSISSTIRIDEALVRKVKIWYLEYYITDGKETYSRSVYLHHKFKREEAIKYLKLIYDVLRYEYKHFSYGGFCEKRLLFMMSDEYKASKDKRASLLVNLRHFHDVSYWYSDMAYCDNEEHLISLLNFYEIQIKDNKIRYV